MNSGQKQSPSGAQWKVLQIWFSSFLIPSIVVREKVVYSGFMPVRIFIIWTLTRSIWKDFDYGKQTEKIANSNFMTSPPTNIIIVSRYSSAQITNMWSWGLCNSWNFKNRPYAHFFQCCCNFGQSLNEWT